MIGNRIIKFLKSSAAIIIMSNLILISRAHAQVDLGIKIPGSNGQTGVTFNQYVQDIYKFSTIFGGLLTVLMLTYAGYKYMTSQGNPTAINEAKDILLGSLSGLGMLFLVYVIWQALNIK